MIVKGFSIQRGQTHATHLMRVDENEHVELHEVRGFASGNLHGAFKEAQAIAGGTKCKQYPFSCVFFSAKFRGAFHGSIHVRRR